MRPEKYVERQGTNVQYHEVKINIDFETKVNCATDGNNGPSGDLSNVSLWVDYIFLDTDERKNRLRSKVACRKHSEKPLQLVEEFSFCKTPCCSGTPLQLYLPKVHRKMFPGQERNLGMVKMIKIGQPACLLPNDVMLVNGRTSETERVLSYYESLDNWSNFKIQSSLCRNAWEFCEFEAFRSAVS